ncbi:zinc metalloproteinase, partial [Lactobacillus delbrueckii]|nr:zinc metalloproteinase [Lactobacillus delbrueckii]MDF4030551.1 zinc metalloproteinase [Lactobacillus delbrueckii]
MKRNKILASVSTAALALGMLTVIGKKQVNAADNDDPANIVTVVNYTPTKSAVTAVKTSYNAKTKSLTITGKAKGASKVAVSYNAKALKPVKVSKKGQFKTTVKFTGYKDFTLTGLNAKGAA